MKTDIQQILMTGGVGVLATDTLYGLVGQALNPKTVERIYQLKRRQPYKPCIILISSVSDIGIFGINVSVDFKNVLQKYWPGPVSVVLSCSNLEFQYLHRGTCTLAFRIPDKPPLRKLLASTGPLIAPSANLENEPPATTIMQARKYFGDAVDFYAGGRTKKRPSQVIQFHDNKIIELRS